MAKYSDEFKLRVLKEFLEGKLSYKRLAAKHKLGHFYILQRWVHARTKLSLFQIHT